MLVIEIAANKFVKELVNVKRVVKILNFLMDLKTIKICICVKLDFVRAYSPVILLNLSSYLYWAPSSYCGLFI